jgi:hypothetical protein
MGETCAPKAKRKTHSEVASRSQFAAAQMPARYSSCGFSASTCIRSATFFTKDDTVWGLTNGKRAESRLRTRSACFSPRVISTTKPAKIESSSTPKMAAKP